MGTVSNAAITQEYYASLANYFLITVHRLGPQHSFEHQIQYSQAWNNLLT